MGEEIVYFLGPVGGGVNPSHPHQARPARLFTLARERNKENGKQANVHHNNILTIPLYRMCLFPAQIPNLARAINLSYTHFNRLIGKAVVRLALQQLIRARWKEHP